MLVLNPFCPRALTCPNARVLTNRGYIFFGVVRITTL
jgi:hypothetical protein